MILISTLIYLTRSGRSSNSIRSGCVETERISHKIDGLNEINAIIIRITRKYIFIFV